MHMHVYMRARTSTQIKIVSFYVCCDELPDLPQRYAAGEKRSLDVCARLYIATLETLGGKIITCTYSSKEIADLKKYYDDTKFVNSRLTVFSCGELMAGMNLLGICIARDGQSAVAGMF